MVSKTDSRMQPLNLECTTHPAISGQPSILKNHQNWQFSRHLDCETGLPVFQLIDPYGLFVTTTEFVVENVDACFRQALLQLKTPEEQQRFVCEYLQRQLAQATPYRVHIERYRNKVVVRFGGYGLKGGGKLFDCVMSGASQGGGRPWEIMMVIVSGIVLTRFLLNRSRKSAWSGSWVAALSGIYLFTTQGSILARLVGTCLTSAGISGGTYVYSNGDASYKAEEFVQQSGYGGLIGLISGGFGTLTQGGGFLTTVGSQALGGAAGNGIVAAIESAGEQEARKKEVVNKTIAGALGGGVSAIVGMATHHVMNQAAVIKDSVTGWAFLEDMFLGARRLGPYTADSLLCATVGYIGFLIFKKFAQGGLSAMSSRIVTNLYESRLWNYRLQESALIGAATGTAIGVGEIANEWQVVYQNSALCTIRTARGANNEPDAVELQLNQKIQQGEKAWELNKTSLAPVNGYRSEKATAEEKARKVEEAIRPDSVGFLNDSELGGLMPHVVLVHAIRGQSAQFLADVDSHRLDTDPCYKMLSALRFILNSQGVIGYHLDFEKREFQKEFIDRPHTHWSWNQLVQPNSGGDWEDAPIALLEPLSTFENSICNKPFGVAPYDTFIFGPHRLSDKSILLVPEDLQETDIRAYLTGFKGKIVKYNPAQKLRSAVLETLKDHYHDVWQVCDENGNLIGGKARAAVGAGHESVTCLKKTNGEVLRLIRDAGSSENDQISGSMQKYRGLQRYIGLHCDAPTDAFENEKDKKKEKAFKYFQSLKGFTNFNNDARDRDLYFAGKFSGNVDFLENSNVLMALKFYDETLGDLNQESQDRSGIFDPKTGVRVVANYVMRTAMHADLASLFYKKYRLETFDLSPFELKIIFEPMDEIIIVLNSVKESLKNGNKDAALSFFTKYCLTLEERLDHMLKARKLTQSLKEQGKVDDPDTTYGNSLCLMIGLDDWKTIEVPAEIKFDLGNNQSQSETLYRYILKVLHVLPSNLEKRKGLYHYLSSMSLEGKDRKEQYRQTVLRSILRYAVQERLYLDLRNDKTESILAFKISKLAGWLQEYGLEIKDGTKKAGDCLFDNVAAQLGDGGISSKSLRTAVVEFMRQHEGDHYSSQPDYQAKTLKWKGKNVVEFDNWEGYLTCMGMAQVWATDIEIEALASMLKCPIVLMESGSKPKIYNREAKNNPIFLHPMEMVSEISESRSQSSAQTDSNSTRRLTEEPKKSGEPLPEPNGVNTSRPHQVTAHYFESCIPFNGLNINEIYSQIKRGTDGAK